MKPEWKLKKISDIATVMNGGTPDTNRKDFWGGNILWITPKDMGKLSSIYVDDTERKITDAGLKNSSAKIIPPNSIILSSRAPIGHLAINNFKISTNQGCKGIIPKKEILTKYLFYFLRNSIELLNSLGTGTTFKELSSSKLNDVEIPLPPLPEQQRIVDILDQSFAAIDQAIENTEKNIIHLFDLTKSYLTSILENKQDGDWIQKKIKSISTKIGSGATPLGGKNSYQKKGISLIRSLNVYDDGFQYKNLAFIDEKQAQKLSSVEIEKRDILLNITGASILRCCVVPEGVLPARVNQHVLILRPVENIILPEFLHLLIISSDYKSSLLQIAKAGGSTREALTKEGVSNFKISFPKEISEQEKLVNLYNSFVAQSDKLRNNYYQKIEKLQELKQSILHKAFNGEL